jgi:nitrate/nitrite transport system permease protein
MVSAVFHNPLASQAQVQPADQTLAATADTTVLVTPPGTQLSPRHAAQGTAAQRWLTGAFARIAPGALGLVLLVAVWALLTARSTSFPTPWQTWDAGVALFANPFYQNGPNDQGIGWNLLASLQRVALGFGLAALVGIPLGFLMGRLTFVQRMLQPLISILRPVSPLAWLPIGLLIFKSANPAAIGTIFICSIWPMLINTAVGVQRVPQDYLNVARVLGLSQAKVITRILLPAVLPYVLTGVRLSVGTAWLVIVAAEMLTGGVGIGFWIWDEWNNLNVKHILVAIVVIGTVGWMLESALVWLAGRMSHAHD